MQLAVSITITNSLHKLMLLSLNLHYYSFFCIPLNFGSIFGVCIRRISTLAALRNICEANCEKDDVKKLFLRRYDEGTSYVLVL